MSDHDTADQALEAALRGWHNQDHEGRVMCLVEDGSMAEYLLQAAAALARRIAEGQWRCPLCGTQKDTEDAWRIHMYDRHRFGENGEDPHPFD